MSRGGRRIGLQRLGLAGPQVPVHLASLQCREAGVALASSAFDAAGRTGAFRRGGGSFPQHCRARRSLLGWDGLSLVLHQELATQLLWVTSRQVV